MENGQWRMGKKISGRVVTIKANEVVLGFKIFWASGAFPLLIRFFFPSVGFVVFQMKFFRF